MDIQNFFSGLDAAFASGSNDSIADYLRNSLNEAEQEQDKNAIIAILNETAGYYRTRSEFSRAIQAGERAVTLLKELGYTESSAYGTTLMNLATAYMAAGDTAKAMQLYENTLEIYKKTLPANDPSLAGLYNNMGSLCLSLGQDKKAIELLQKALETTKSSLNSPIETAIICTNLAQATLRLGKKDVAKQLLQAAIETFETAQARRAPHYAAALAAMAKIYYDENEYVKSIASYETALDHIKECHGENKDFATTCDNFATALDAVGEKQKAEAARHKAQMVRERINTSEVNLNSAKQKIAKLVNIEQNRDKRISGLELAQLFYENYGKDMLHSHFPAYANRVAAGLVGEGSECFGFDDMISTDHDFGPAFCLWLTPEDYENIGMAMQEAYTNLPISFMGIPTRKEGPQSSGRIGVLRIDSFYRNLTGYPNAEITLEDWLYIPEKRLAAATNGVVFSDPLGVFSQIRNKFLSFYPEDVRLKKIASRAVGMGQSGQYNYARSMARGEIVAASLALNEFIRYTCSMIFLLNKKYAPFYKWTHRGLSQLPFLSEVALMLENLIANGIHTRYWQNTNPKTLLSTLNLQDPNIEIIENICSLVKSRLQNDGLSNNNGNFMTLHAGPIMQHITDPAIRSLPLQIMEG